MAEKPHKQNIVKMQSRAGKVANQSIRQGEIYSASFRVFPSKIAALSQFKSWEKSMKIRRFYENRTYQEAKDNHDLF
ncbi:hypothetical protein [Dysosmobacter sp.]|uniref:hypothetical protein n=1 Tax=Dysosmobacter sp. TaxID=2591382 RepID=UPI003AB207FD